MRMCGCAPLACVPLSSCVTASCEQRAPQDLATSMPGCAGLGRASVDHDYAKSCALASFAFTLAVENSEDEGSGKRQNTDV